jgi:hypothetical protein
MTQAPALPFSKIWLAQGLAFLSGEMPIAEITVTAAPRD